MQLALKLALRQREICAHPDDKQVLRLAHYAATTINGIYEQLLVAMIARRTDIQGHHLYAAILGQRHSGAEGAGNPTHQLTTFIVLWLHCDATIYLVRVVVSSTTTLSVTLSEFFSIFFEF